MVHQRRAAAAEDAEARGPGAQAVVGVLEVGLVVLRQAADRVDQLALDVGAGEHDPLDLAVVRVLVHVGLEGADLLAPAGVGQDDRSGVQQPPVGQDQPAADDADVRRRRGGARAGHRASRRCRTSMSLFSRSRSASRRAAAMPTLLPRTKPRLRSLWMVRTQSSLRSSASVSSVLPLSTAMTSTSAEVGVLAERRQASSGQRPLVPAQDDDRDGAGRGHRGGTGPRRAQRRAQLARDARGLEDVGLRPARERTRPAAVALDRGGIAREQRRVARGQVVGQGEESLVQRRELRLELRRAGAPVARLASGVAVECRAQLLVEPARDAARAALVRWARRCPLRSCSAPMPCDDVSFPCPCGDCKAGLARRRPRERARDRKKSGLIHHDRDRGRGHCMPAISSQGARTGSAARFESPIAPIGP